MNIRALSHLHLPKIQSPVEPDDFLGQVPVAFDRATRPAARHAEPAWPHTELPGERNDLLWDPFDPPLYG